MATIAENLAIIKKAKEDIKAALEAKGVRPGNILSTYAAAIDTLPVGVLEDGLTLLGYDEETARSYIETFKMKFHLNKGVTTYSTGVMFLDNILNTSSQTNFSDMFEGCYSLLTIPKIDTANGTDFSYMFNACSSLVTIPKIDTSNGINFSDMFTFCTNLLIIPAIDTGNGTNFSDMFMACLSLLTLPQLNTQNGTNLSNMFYACESLHTLPKLKVHNCTSFNNMFYHCWNLAVFGGLEGAKYSFDVSYCSKLTHDSLINVLNGLAIVTSKQTLTLGSTNLAKLTDEEKAIAISKGWTLA